MSASWKQVLYEYVRYANQRDMEYQMDGASSFVKDEAFLDFQRRRLSRIRDWHEERGTKPLEHETKLKLLGVKERETSVIAEIEMACKQQYRTAGQTQTAFMKERERVTLASRNGILWYIERVEPIIQERAQAAKASVSQRIPSSHDSLSAKPPKIGSTPLLNRAAVPGGASEVRKTRYNREAAVHYADTHWDNPSPDYIHFDVDCTNYVSQCLFAGSAPMNYTGRRESGWWYKGGRPGSEQWSFSWSVAHSLRWYLATSSTHLRAEEVQEPQQLKLGDVIVYDFDGDDQFQHSTIVTAFDGNGMPLVNAHTSNSRHRYWDYKDSYAWSDTIRYKFFHILDDF
ncbi:amidase domain-containing protein [Paenibacillus turpanensis]|uniref:amidase domain-containing protein n=1 Tax=Paenibacillus turpanensis TaxID=2689078 RepID=UPI00140BC8F6|nr:amidase domain-containing protein [Paenibacillus turpanensis]